MNNSESIGRTLGFIYTALLSIPYGKWRAENQPLYCSVLYALADIECRSNEEVQNFYEAFVELIKENR